MTKRLLLCAALLAMFAAAVNATPKTQTNRGRRPVEARQATKPTPATPTPAAVLPTVKTPAAALRAAILKQADPNPFGGGTVAVYVVDARTSEVVVDLNSTEPLRPASCNKLLTTAAGLSLLGPTYRFVTELFYDGTLRDGVLSGSLVVRGGGDPTISGRFQADKRDVTAQLRQWARGVRAVGVTTVTGDLVADDRVFDRVFFHPTWYADERGEWYEAEVWGLSFNDNCVDLLWSGVGRLPGDKAGLTVNPPNTYARVRNEVSVVAKGRDSLRTYERDETSNDILATGTMATGAEKEDSASVHNGALYFCAVLRDELASAGVALMGRPRMATDAEAFDFGGAMVELGRIESPPLTEVVKVINRNSQNFYAECLAKMLGRRLKGQGSFEAGTAVVRGFLKSRGIAGDEHSMVDGSGLSDRNRVTARTLAGVVALMDGGTMREAWRDSFPVGGVRGTIRDRFKQTTESQALAKQIMGKTGLIGGVRSMTGIVVNRKGREFYYCINVNGFRSPQSKVIDFIDTVAVTVAGSDY